MRLTRTASCLLFLMLPATAQLTFDLPLTDVAGSGSTLYAITGSSLFRTSDGGTNWVPAYVSTPGRPQPIGRVVVSAPGDPSVAYVAGDSTQGGVWKTSDAGATWVRASSGLPAVGIDSLFTVADQRKVLYARAGNKLYKTADGGDTWRLQSTLPGSDYAFTINVKTPSLMFYVGDPGSRASSPYATVYRSTDEGASWQAVVGMIVSGPGADIPNACMSIASSPANPDIVYLSNRGPWLSYGDQAIAGLWKSSNRGAYWQNVRPQEEPYLIAADLAGNIFFTSPEAGATEFTKTTDGVTFRRLRVGPGEQGPPVLRLDLATPGAMLAGGSKGAYRSTDAGETWRWLGGSAKATLEAPASALALRAAAGSTLQLNLDLKVQFLEKPALSAAFDISASGESWLSLNTRPGVTPATITIRLDTTGLEEGSHQSTIRITSPAAAALLEIPVTITIGGPVTGPAYVISAVSGNGKSGYAGDGGPVDAARLSSPRGLAFDRNGSLYIADSANHRIRRVRAGIIETVAGTGQFGRSGDGQAATQAQLWRPSAVAFDVDGGYYIVDEYNDRLRRVNNKGVISTFAAGLYGIGSVASDSAGAAYVSQNGSVRKYNTAGTADSTYASGLGVAAGMSFDSRGNLYIADSGNHRVWEVAAANLLPVAIAGSGGAGDAGDGKAAIESLLNAPTAVALDSEDRLYIADTGNHRIRMVDRDGRIYTIAGSVKGYGGDEGLGALALLNSPSGLAVDTQGNIYIADSGNHSIRKLSPLRPEIQSGGVRNLGGAAEEISPGGLFIISGRDLAAGSASATQAPWPNTLAGATVTVGGRTAPLYSATAQQISGQLPQETALGAVEVVVSVNGASSSPAIVQVIEAAPGILQTDQNRCSAHNQDGSINSAENPAEAGSSIVVFLVGIGPVDNPVGTGAAAPMEEPWSRPTLPARVTLGGREITPDFLGLMPGAVGLAQMNITLPEDLATGDYPVQVTIADQSSNAPVLAVRSK